MANPVDLVEVWRGDLLECVHQGHAVICDDTGQIAQSWGDPGAIIYPRSSCKMVLALPLLDSGAGAQLSDEHLALACASHNGAAIHTDRVGAWMKDLGLTDDAFRCGPQMPTDRAARTGGITFDATVGEVHAERRRLSIEDGAHVLGAGPHLRVDDPLAGIRIAVPEVEVGGVDEGRQA